MGWGGCGVTAAAVGVSSAGSSVRAPRVLSVPLHDDAEVGGDRGRQGVIVGRDFTREGCWVEVVEDGEVVRRSAIEVALQRWADYLARHPEVTPDRHCELLSWLPHDQRITAMTLQAHLLDVLDGIEPRPWDPTFKPGPYDRETTTVSQRRAAKREELAISDDKLGRLLRTLRSRGVLELVPAVGRKIRASKLDQVDPRILMVVRHFVQERELAGKRTLTNEHSQVLVRLRNHGLVAPVAGASDADGQPLPKDVEALSYDRFCDLVAVLTGGRLGQSARVKKSQSRRPDVDGMRHHAYQFGESIQVDSTVCDFFVWGPDGPQRVWALFAVDVATRYMWVRLLTQPPRGVHLGLLLWDVIVGDSMLLQPSTPPRPSSPKAGSHFSTKPDATSCGTAPPQKSPRRRSGDPAPDGPARKMIRRRGSHATTNSANK